MAWTKSRVEELKKLWAEGLSAAQIARTMGDVTRNSVIGKVHRLGLTGRSVTPAADRPRRAQIPKPKPKPVVAEPAKIEAATLGDGAHITVLTLQDHMCKWPIGVPRHPDFHFCGRHSAEGETYCETHALLAYQPRNRGGTTSTSTAAPYKTKRARFT